MKSFRLFKRRDDGTEMAATEPGYKDRSYYFRFTFRGTSYPRCLETTEATEAQRRARLKFREITEAVTRGEIKRLEATKLRHTIIAPLADYLKAYKGAPGPDNPAPNPKITIRLKSSLTTRTRNCAALLNLLGQMLEMKDDAVLTTPINQLITADMTKRWFARHAAAARSRKVSANSLFTQAASIFQPIALEIYAQMDLPVANLAGFCSARVHQFAKSDLGEQPYEPPSHTIIEATLAAWRQLGVTGTDRNLYLAIGHELAFGLRVGEIGQARWNWWQTKFDSPMLIASGKFKHNRLGKFEVPALDPWYSEMAATIERHRWRTKPEDHILTGTDCHRTDEIFRQASDWLRQLGWETNKTNHALRAWAGCQIAIRYSVFDAQRFLRHSSIKTTQDHYLYLLNGPHMEYLRRTCTSKWAALNQPTQPTVSGKDATLDASDDFRKTPLDYPTVLPWFNKQGEIKGNRN